MRRTGSVEDLVGHRLIEYCVTQMSGPFDVRPYTDFDLTVTSIHNVIEKICPPGWEFAWTRRRHDGLIHVIEGAATFSASEWTHTVPAGGVLYVEREDSYRVVAGSDGGRLIVANFLVERSGPIRLSLRRVVTGRSALYSTLFGELVHAWTGKAIGHKIRCKSTLLSILYNVAHDTIQEKLHARGIAQIQPALTQIENAFHTDVRVADLARAVGVTPAHFRRVFKDIIGYTPKEYILYLRVTRAMDYVKSDLYSIAEIAERVGFSSGAHFSRVFKEHTGCSPIEYRRGV